MSENPQRPPARRVSAGRGINLTTETNELLSQIQGRVETFDSASRIWHDYLTGRERFNLGGELEDAWHRYHGTLGMVSHVRKCSPNEALLWLCEVMEALPAARLRSLRQELGLPGKAEQSPPPSSIPSWHKVRGELSLGGKVIRRFRSTKVAHRAVAILDAFEACGWCEHIENPLKSGDEHQMREAIYSLNKRLKRIRFKSDGTSAGIRWERR